MTRSDVETPGETLGPRPQGRIGVGAGPGGWGWGEEAEVPSSLPSPRPPQPRGSFPAPPAGREVPPRSPASLCQAPVWSVPVALSRRPPRLGELCAREPVIPRGTRAWRGHRPRRGRGGGAVPWRSRLGARPRGSRSPQRGARCSLRDVQCRSRSWARPWPPGSLGGGQGPQLRWREF